MSCHFPCLVMGAWPLATNWSRVVTMQSLVGGVLLIFYIYPRDNRRTKRRPFQSD